MKLKMGLLAFGAMLMLAGCGHSDEEMAAKQREVDALTADLKASRQQIADDQKKYADAEPLLLSGYEGMSEREAQIPPVGKPRLTETIRRLVDLYDAWDKKDKADEWRKRLSAQKQ